MGRNLPTIFSRKLFFCLFVFLMVYLIWTLGSAIQHCMEKVKNFSTHRWISAGKGNYEGNMEKLFKKRRKLLTWSPRPLYGLWVDSRDLQISWNYVHIVYMCISTFSFIFCPSFIDTQSGSKLRQLRKEIKATMLQKKEGFTKEAKVLGIHGRFSTIIRHYQLAFIASACLAI